MKKITMLLAMAFCFATQSYASHLAGGEIRYEFDGSNYQLKLILYRDCTGAPMPLSATVNISSASKGTSMTLNLQQISYKNITTPCPGTTNNCYNTQSIVPGYAVAEYTGALAIPSTATDWVISYDGTARSATTNVTNGGNMYVYTTLNNTVGDNSNTFIPSVPQLYMAINGSVNIPLQALDPDGDSIVVTRIAPKVSATSNVSYSTGYGATTPFGSTGTYTIQTNGSNPAITLQSGGTTGKFNLAYEVQEYRNGVLVSTYIRDFVTNVLPGTANFSYPEHNVNDPYVVYACPGKTGSATLHFADPVNTDSVYITSDVPNIPGWGLTVVTNFGKPNAQVTVTWNAPTNLNPQTLPYFYVKLHVRDNACPMAISEYALLVKTQQCPIDSVWPGDANYDKIVNILDPLTVALGYNKTGSARSNATINWAPQVATDWAYNFPLINVNGKHGDCNGDGIINLGDLPAIVANYGQTHPKSGQNKPTAGPDLYFDLSGIWLSPGATVSIPIKLGTTANPMNNIYGVAANVQVYGLPLGAQATLSLGNSWIGDAAHTLMFNKDFSNNSVDWVVARNDQQNVSGNGTIGMLSFTVPANATVGSTIKLAFDDIHIIDNQGKAITTFNPKDEDVLIVPTGINNTMLGINNLMIIPNPSGNNAQLRVQLSTDAQLTVTVTDVVGKNIYTETLQANAGNNMIALPAANVSAGMYTVQVSIDGAPATQTLKWVKQQ